MFSLIYLEDLIKFCFLFYLSFKYIPADKVLTCFCFPYEGFFDFVHWQKGYFLSVVI